MTGDNDGLGAKSETNEPPLRLIAGLTGLWSLRLARPSAMGRPLPRTPLSYPPPSRFQRWPSGSKKALRVTVAG